MSNLYYFIGNEKIISPKHAIKHARHRLHGSAAVLLTTKQVNDEAHNVLSWSPSAE